ncbi:MAG: putative 4-hydroxybenzoate polyprenyltransferase [Bacteroidetes bacterium]|nr:putative 4-hydroxybenzoate polyprenyltransferase [Bacteroidota bacterium]
MQKQFEQIGNYFSLVKIHHTLFSLPFAMIGLFLAFKEKGSVISLRDLLLVLLCVLFARNAAMAFNRYADVEFDGKNPRTAARELPKNIISRPAALAFIVLNAILFMAAAYFLNILCFLLSPVALIVVLGYSLTKRFTSLSHVFLGLGLSLAPIGAYIAVTAHFAILPLLFSFSVIFWVAGFDIIYAMQDVDFDESERLKSLPVFLGSRNALLLSIVFHVISVGFLVTAGFIGPFGRIYWAGMAVYTALIIYQHVLVKPNDLSRVNLAFFTLNGIASVIYACFVIADLYL